MTRQERKMINNYENEKCEFNKDIVDVIGKRLTLERRGNNYWCLCPFHSGKPQTTMCISREHQIFKCFDCNASGSLITFLQKYEGGYDIH